MKNKYITISEVSKLSGISIRTLQYYDNIDLLKPSHRTDTGYRLYSEKNLIRLRDILFFKELELSLKDIKTILDNHDLNRNTIIDQQIRHLTLKKEHIEKLIEHAENSRNTGDFIMDFSAFNDTKLKEYSERAKETWGTTDAYKECDSKTKNLSTADTNNIINEFMNIFKEFGEMKNLNPSDKAVQNQVQKLQNYINNHFYQCSNEILLSLGSMYAAGGEFTENIDNAGGQGTAEFTNKAIEYYCSDNS